MRWIDSLERRFSSFAIPGLIRYVAVLSAAVFILYKINPGFLSLLDLNPVAIRHGEIWRLVTYVFIPSAASILGLPDVLFAIFYLMFLWWIGDGLDSAWGAFRTNLYFLLGMIGTTAAGFFFGTDFSNLMINASLFYAFARFYPDVVIYVAFILPVKVKWLAWISFALLLLGFLTRDRSYKMAVLAALANYLIFFGKEIYLEARHRNSSRKRRQEFKTAARPETEALHLCKTCNRTENTNPELEFRVAADGEEYCTEHLPARSAAA